MAGEQRRRRLRALLAQAGVPDANVAAFEAAFVHESAVKERLAERSNERLEFLGDSILGFVVARSLFERYREAPEGELALRKNALVADAALAETADRLGFGEILLLGAGLANALPERRRSPLADAFEAFVAVLYREAGDGAVAAFVLREHVLPIEATGADVEDPKSVLQEWMQRRGVGTPEYVDRYTGPDHARTFFAEVTVDGDLHAQGSGPSKKAAQRAAAAAALVLLDERYNDVTRRRLSDPSGTPGDATKPARKRIPRPGVKTKRTTVSKTQRP